MLSADLLQNDLLAVLDGNAAIVVGNTLTSEVEDYVMSARVFSFGLDAERLDVFKQVPSYLTIVVCSELVGRFNVGHAGVRHSSLFTYFIETGAFLVCQEGVAVDAVSRSSNSGILHASNQQVGGVGPKCC